MNRTIKFRAWCAVEKRFLTPHEASAMIFESGNCWAAGNLGENYKDDYPYAVEWMQFTSLHDKNGVEIYEGDIIRCPHFIDYAGEQQYLKHRIVWSEAYTGWMCISLDNKENESGTTNGNVQLWVYVKNHPAEVIGNVFQSNSLLQS